MSPMPLAWRAVVVIGLGGLVILGACGGKEGLGDSSGDAPDDTGDVVTETGDSDSGDCDSVFPTKANIGAYADVELGDVIFLGTDGDTFEIDGVVAPGSAVSTFVAPGRWWIVALDPTGSLCDRSDDMDVEACETVFWTVDTFPGVFHAEALECTLGEAAR